MINIEKWTRDELTELVLKQELELIRLRRDVEEQKETLSAYRVIVRNEEVFKK